MNLKCWIKSIIAIVLLKIYFPKITFRILEESEEIEKMNYLVWEVYALEKKYIDPQNSSPSMLNDEFEKHSIHIGAFNESNNIIGAVRIILPSHEGFYVEKDFNVEIPNYCYKKSAEISRLVVLKNYRNEIISFGLLRKALEMSKKRGIDYWIVVIPKKIKDHFSKSFGIKFRQLKLKELTEKQLKIRAKLPNYYKICNPMPYLISLKEIY